MFRFKYLIRDPISFVGGPWRDTADLVRGRVVTILDRYNVRPVVRGAYTFFCISACLCVCTYVRVNIHVCSLVLSTHTHTHTTHVGWFVLFRCH